MFTLWPHCYVKLLSSTCLSQPLHYAVQGGGEGGGGGPSGGSGSEGEKQVRCCCSCCVYMCVAGLCVGVFMQRRQIKPVCYTVLATRNFTKSADCSRR